MNTERKNKARKSREDREKATIAPIKPIGEQTTNGIKKPAQVLLDEQLKPKKVDSINAPSMPTLATTEMSAGINVPDAAAPTGSLPSADRLKVKMPSNTVEAVNPTGVPSATPSDRIKEVEKPMTLSDYLEEQRKKLVKEKTDAVKMQKYYALTDAFNALGKMGGAAIGGAIGGNMLDSAPAVGEYKESRGYLDAFERAKQANDRLRALDEKEFNLAYNKQQRDEDRAYQKEQRREEREFQAEQNKLAREFQAEQARITREWNKAVADADFARQAELKKEILELQNRYAASDDARSKEYLQKQYELYNTPHLVMFRDGTSANFTTQQLTDMLENYIGQTVGGVKITKDNFGEVLRSNPQAFAEYFSMVGVTPASKAAANVATKDSGDPIDFYNQKPSVKKNQSSEAAKDTGKESESEGLSHEEKLDKWRNRN